MTAEDRYDVDSLTPIQYLVMEALAARYRLGETVWTFPTRVITLPRLAELDDLGLIWWKHGIVEHTYLIALTELGIRSTLSVDYVPPIRAGQAS